MNKIVVLLLSASLLLPGCQTYVSEPCAPITQVWRIRVENHTGEVFDIDLNGVYLATITPQASIRTAALEDSHLLQAWDVDGTERARRDFYLGSDFVWVLEY